MELLQEQHKQKRRWSHKQKPDHMGKTRWGPWGLDKNTLRTEIATSWKKGNETILQRNQRKNYILCMYWKKELILKEIKRMKDISLIQHEKQQIYSPNTHTPIDWHRPRHPSGVRPLHWSLQWAWHSHDLPRPVLPKKLRAGPTRLMRLPKNFEKNQSYSLRYWR